MLQKAVSKRDQMIVSPCQTVLQNDCTILHSQQRHIRVPAALYLGGTIFFDSLLGSSHSIDMYPTAWISIFWRYMMWVIFSHACLSSLPLLHWGISMSWSCFTIGVFVSSLLNLKSPCEFWMMVFACCKLFWLLWSLSFHFLHIVFFIFSVIFFHGPCLLYCTFKVIAKSPKVPPL